ncbi:hypothetical protein [Agreia pratensis]|uniref:Uncharacterized protein n=1 Tax=Agreia pratensis TaxID=150121 RepID=A0A1X7JWC0_9MICO|nr:hypothetical protein [Agreia pratensis]SMG32559.1 hypothetical protein SAMN06296010_1919 [Agreia pratensis]
MTTDWLGGGLIIAVAAGLWLIYFMPTWSRRREYLATERNAVRLQQTLRILAETSEVPDEIRASTTARSVAEQQRYLRQVSQDATPVAVLIAARIKRSRAVTSAIFLLSVTVALLAGFQITLAGAWVVVAIGASVASLCVVMLGKLAQAGRSLRLPAPRLTVHDQTLVDHGGSFLEAEPVPVVEPVVPSEWTPIPLPKPLYAARVAAPGLATALPSVAREVSLEIEADLRRAASDAENALRAAASAGPAVAPIELPLAPAEPVAPRPPSRFASMGIVDTIDGSRLDLDEVLARRRAG